MEKIPIEKVQEAFNAAIRWRDGRCMVKDCELCSGQLECSHFFSVGANPALRFYPPNAYTQCHVHHWRHHNKAEPFYTDWMKKQHPADFERMEKMRHRYIKYSNALKAEILQLCMFGQLDALTRLLDGLLGG
ncbi:MAG: recombination protein NinG [Treponema sp.]|nr:recombination protein NinG [Treponema sp.]